MTQNNNFNAKKVIAGLIAAGMLASGSAVFAEYNPDKVIDTSLEYTTLSTDDEVQSPVENAITYNGASVNIGTEEVNGHKMFPLRYVFENLGFEVTWVEESQKIQLNRGAVEIGMYIGQDSYYLSKRMPEPLGAAPTLINDETTYVPIEVLTDMLELKVIDNNDGTVLIVDPAQVSFKNFNADENDYKSITVNDASKGDVIVYITDNTEITVNGEKGSIEDIKNLETDTTIEVGYGVAMTMSLPPQTSAVLINITTADNGENTAVENIEFTGIIKEVEEDRILIENNGNELVLTISDDTLITRGNDKRVYKIDDLTVGTEVKGMRSGVEAQSLPPISNAVSIEILNLAE